MALRRAKKNTPKHSHRQRNSSLASQNGNQFGDDTDEGFCIGMAENAQQDYETEDEAGKISVDLGPVELKAEDLEEKATMGKKAFLASTSTPALRTGGLHAERFSQQDGSVQPMEQGIGTEDQVQEEFEEQDYDDDFAEDSETLNM